MKEQDDLLISIIIPIYNVKAYLCKCIDSVINQIYTNLEIILVDDGSTDGCAKICDDFARRDSRVKVVHKVHGGVTSARKAGAEMATGEYILSVDSDDWIESHWISKLEGHLHPEKPDILFAQGFIRDYPHYQKRERFLPYCGYFKGNLIERQLLPHIIRNGDFCNQGLHLAHWQSMVKRDLYLNVEMKMLNEINLHEDVCALLLMIDQSNTIKVVRAGGYHYVHREGSIIDTYSKNTISIEYLKKVYEFVSENITNTERKSGILCNLNLLSFVGGMFGGCNMLQRKDCNHLIPYPQVTKGSRVVIYGAGRVGRSVLNALGDKYTLVAIADSNKFGEKIENEVIIGIDEIQYCEYDYIVVAVLYAWLANEIREQLVENGVPYEKIAIMQTDDITENILNG